MVVTKTISTAVQTPQQSVTRVSSVVRGTQKCRSVAQSLVVDRFLLTFYQNGRDSLISTHFLNISTVSDFTHVCVTGIDIT